jgi:hypothetical protein
VFYPTKIGKYWEILKKENSTNFANFSEIFNFWKKEKKKEACVLPYIC